MKSGAGAAASIAAAVAVLLMVTVLDDPGETKTAAKCPTAEGDLPPDGSGSVAQGVPSGRLSKPMRSGDATLTSSWRSADRPGHRGVDLAGPLGAPIFAMAEGVVTHAGTASGFGHWIVIDHRIDGELITTVYGHMFAEGLHVTPGQQVTAGQHIADEGNDGESTGPHLHFEVRPGGLGSGQDIDPVPWIERAAEPGISEPSPSPTPPVLVTTTTPSTQPAPDEMAALPTPGDSTAAPTSPGSKTPTAATCNNSSPPPEEGPDEGGGELATDEVPEEFRKWLVLSAKQCRELSPALLAAQIKAESGFTPGLTSPAGAQGYTQFMPATWASFGYSIDDNGNQVGAPGQGDPNRIPDAVMAQGAYNCHVIDTLKPYLADGRVSGDPVKLMLAAYNAGPGAVIEYGGIPPYGETQAYVSKITAQTRAFEGVAQ